MDAWAVIKSESDSTPVRAPAMAARSAGGDAEVAASTAASEGRTGGRGTALSVGDAPVAASVDDAEAAVTVSVAGGTVGAAASTVAAAAPSDDVIGVRGRPRAGRG